MLLHRFRRLSAKARAMLYLAIERSKPLTLCPQAPIPRLPPAFSLIILTRYINPAHHAF
jgi:hypothetical protein